jgi:hypothetical protein
MNRINFNFSKASMIARTAGALLESASKATGIVVFMNFTTHDCCRTRHPP